MKKAIFWIVLGVVALLALVFHFMVTRPKAKQHATQREELVKREKKLGELASRGRRAGGLPGRNPDKTLDWIESTKLYVKDVNDEIRRCEKLFVPQRRRTQRRLFYENPDFPDPQEIDGRVKWVDRYEKRCDELRNQIARIAGGVGGSGALNFRSWGNKIPKWEEIKVAQTEFWFQKDLADILANQAAEDLPRFFKYRGEASVASLFELTRNPDIEVTEALLLADRVPAIVSVYEKLLRDKLVRANPRLDENERRELQKKADRIAAEAKEKLADFNEKYLRSLLQALLLNPGRFDLPALFGEEPVERILRPVLVNLGGVQVEVGVIAESCRLVWQRLLEEPAGKAEDVLKGRQVVVKVSPEQRAVIDELVPRKGGRRQLDKLHLVHYAEDLRSVRYLTDIRELCRAYGETELAKLLKEHNQKHTEDTRDAVLDHVREWELPKVAHMIAVLISIDRKDQKDLEILAHNHKVDIGALDAFRMTSSSGGDSAPVDTEGGGEPASVSGSAQTRSFIVPGVPGLYDVISFDLTVRMEFRKLPVLFRRLGSSDWHIIVKHIDISKAGVLTKRDLTSEEQGRPRPVGPDREGEGARGRAEPGKEAGSEETPRSVTPPKEVVRVALKCEAKHFRPLAVRILDQKAEVEKR